MNTLFNFLTFNKIKKDLPLISLVVIVPLLLAIYILNIPKWDLSVPLIYRNSDDIWQLVLTKVLYDTGWVLSNPFLGAPDVANWHHNAAAQTSALHSVIMLALSTFLNDAVKVQQYYYLINFSFISFTSFVACRLLGINKFAAFSIGVLFSFTTFRLNEMLYAFLSNYFMIPLAIVPVVWIILGVFGKMLSNDGSSYRLDIVKSLISSKQFILGLFFIILMALSDGYYAFFTLLLLGFATLVRVISGDWKSPLKLFVPIVYIFTILVIALALLWPLHNYKLSHHEEFFPNGVEDTSLIKHPFEAEVYSTTLKMLIAPIPKHHITSLGNFGKWVVETSDGARAFKNGRNLVPLGTLATVVFFVALVHIGLPRLSKNTSNEKSELSDTLLCLVFFIFLSSILGGIGTLIALIFPDIRAYDRFPLFLIFVLYAYAGNAFTRIIDNAGYKASLILYVALCLITTLALYDQIPRDAAKGEDVSKRLFLSERKFVEKVEASLPKGAMVYQYPYSQYLQDNMYYGWGSFSHVRMYLHSKALRWSNGAAKNSAVENWHTRLTHLPLIDRLNELQAVGFKALVIDKAVLSETEYFKVKETIQTFGMQVIEDAESKLTFAMFKQATVHVEYDKDYKSINQLIIFDTRNMESLKLPVLINALALKQYVASHTQNENYLVIRKVDHPKIFLNGETLTRGAGEKPILPLVDMSGEMSCVLASGKPFANLNDTVILTVKNNSDFDWFFDSGSFPIRIGIHLKDNEGKLLRWDDGLRVSAKNADDKDHKNFAEGMNALYVKHGSEGELRFPLSKLNLVGVKNKSFVADFRLVQDGHAWFEHVGCKVKIEN